MTNLQYHKDAIKDFMELYGVEEENTSNEVKLWDPAQSDNLVAQSG